VPLVSPSRKQPDDDIDKQPPSIHTAQLSPVHNAVSMEDDSKQPSSHVVEKDHSKEQLRYLTLGSMAQLTPGSMAQLTPGSMAQLTPDSMTQLTPGSMAQLTPGSMAQLNPGSMTQLTPGSMAQLTPGSMTQLKEDSLGKNQQELLTIPALPQGTACMNSNPPGIFCCVVEKGT
jgi:hypothetical protein